MHSNAPVAIPTVTASSSVTILDSDQLLRLLLRSIPSSQHRPDLQPPVSPQHRPRSHAPTNIAMQPNTDRTAPGSVLKKIGCLFTRLTSTCIKIEEQDPLVKTESETQVKMEAVEADELKEEMIELDLNSNSMQTDGEDSEMEVEYMIIAEKCITASSSSTERPPNRPKSAPRQHRKKTRTSSHIPASAPSPQSELLNSPPVIKRRRQVHRIMKPKRKQRKVPGFH